MIIFLCKVTVVNLLRLIILNLIFSKFKTYLKSRLMLYESTSLRLITSYEISTSISESFYCKIIISRH